MFVTFPIFPGWLCLLLIPAILIVRSLNERKERKASAQITARTDMLNSSRRAIVQICRSYEICSPKTDLTFYRSQLRPHVKCYVESGGKVADLEELLKANSFNLYHALLDGQTSLSFFAF